MAGKKQVEITKEQFRAYQRVQHSGRFNMLTGAHSVMREAHLTQEEYVHVLSHYDQLLDRYGDLGEDDDRSIPGGSV